MNKMDKASAGQVSASAAEIYDAFFVPALFGQWAPRICDAAGIGPGQQVLDVACGTGSATREASGRVGPAGAVTGIDRNPDMLRVARARGDGITWVDGMAEALPFADGSFDRVLCQFGLMFFEDRSGALGEMVRVLRPGGRAVVAVWDAVDTSPGYAAMIALLDRMFGKAAADALRAPFVLADRTRLGEVLRGAGWENAAVSVHGGIARFPSIREWVRMDVRGWTLSDMIDDDQFEALVTAAERELSGFADRSGAVAFDAPALFVSLAA